MYVDTVSFQKRAIADPVLGVCLRALIMKNIEGPEKGRYKTGRLYIRVYLVDVKLRIYSRVDKQFC